MAFSLIDMHLGRRSQKPKIGGLDLVEIFEILWAHVRKLVILLPREGIEDLVGRISVLRFSRIRPEPELQLGLKTASRQVLRFRGRAGSHHGWQKSYQISHTRTAATLRATNGPFGALTTTVGLGLVHVSSSLAVSHWLFGLLALA